MHEHDKDPTLRKLCSSEILRNAYRKIYTLRKANNIREKQKNLKQLFAKKNISWQFFVLKGISQPFGCHCGVV